MPYRKTILANEEIYHVFNRSVASEPIFTNVRDYQRIIDLLDYYRFSDTIIRFSYFNRLNYKQKSDFIYSLRSTDKLVEILSFTIMPNHFHLLLKQNVNGGITKFVRIFQNSYARYLNTRLERSGSVFQSMFKAVRIENEEQLLHVFRYINLNPVTSYIVKSIEDLENYKWCSYKDYVQNKNNRTMVSAQHIGEIIGNPSKIKEFCSNQVNYQRKLNEIKHLIFE